MKFWNRVYDPETGRYISADPIGLAGGMNLFAYVEGNPTNSSDPEGLFCGTGLCIGGAAIIAAVGGVEGIAGHVAGATIVGIIAVWLPYEMSPDDEPEPKPYILPSERPWRKRARWHVYVRCHGVKFNECKSCPNFIGGHAYGGTFATAFAQAQMDANENLGMHGFRDCRARHCQPVACFENGRRRPCPKSGR